MWGDGIGRPARRLYGLIILLVVYEKTRFDSEPCTFYIGRFKEKKVQMKKPIKEYPLEEMYNYHDVITYIEKKYLVDHLQLEVGGRRVP